MVSKNNQLIKGPPIAVIVAAALVIIGFMIYNYIETNKAESITRDDLKEAAKVLDEFHVTEGVYPGYDSGGANLPKSSKTSFNYSLVDGNTGYCLEATSSHAGAAGFYIAFDFDEPKKGACPAIDESHPPAPSSAAGEFVLVPGSPHYGTTDFYVAKYQAKNVDGRAVSQAEGTPWVGLSQAEATAQAAAACDGCRLITEAQWMTLAMNIINTASNWSEGDIGKGVINRGNSSDVVTASPKDNTDEMTGINKRTHTLSNGEVIWDLAGNAWEWTQGRITGSQPGRPGQNGFYGWSNYSDSDLEWNSLSVESRPTGTMYSGDQGVGRINSDPSETGSFAILRGGSYAGDSHVGILMISLINPGDGGRFIGFRTTL